MKLKYVFLICILMSPRLVLADPPWGENEILSFEICDEKYPDNSYNCKNAYKEQTYIQALNFTRSVISEMFNSYKDICGVEEASNGLKAFDDRESAWVEYSARDCVLKTEWGSRYPTSCSFDNNYARAMELINEVKIGLQTPQCTTFSASDNKYLVTEKFIILLNDNCENGMFLCENVRYLGSNRKNGDQIQLSGGYLLDKSANQIGFSFKNGNFEYQTLFDGTLRVVNSESGEIIFKDTGRWTQGCDECYSLQFSD